ncbi:hypothetical protein ACN47E_006439 [Coniothyrium glycines]
MTTFPPQGTHLERRAKPYSSNVPLHQLRYVESSPVGQSNDDFGSTKHHSDAYHDAGHIAEASHVPRKQGQASSQHGYEPLHAHDEGTLGSFDMLPPQISTHFSWQALHDYAQRHASEHGYALSINTTAKNRSRIKLACVCYGQPKNTHKLTPETRVRKNRVSYKTGCKMWIEGKKQGDGTWLLRVGEPQHNHPGRSIESWAVQRKRTWGVAGGRKGSGGVTAKDELAREEPLSDTNEGTRDAVSAENHRSEQGSQVWKIVEQEMMRSNGESGQGRDRGVGRTVQILQAQLPGIRIFKRDVYNIRAQIKRLRKAAGQEIGEGLDKSEDEDNAEPEYDNEYDRAPSPGPSANVQGSHDVDQRCESSKDHIATRVDQPPNAQPGLRVAEFSSQRLAQDNELEHLRRENAQLRNLLGERTEELKEKTIEIAGLRSQIEYMSILSMSSAGATMHR